MGSEVNNQLVRRGEIAPDVEDAFRATLEAVDRERGERALGLVGIYDDVVGSMGKSLLLEAAQISLHGSAPKGFKPDPSYGVLGEGAKDDILAREMDTFYHERKMGGGAAEPSEGLIADVVQIMVDAAKNCQPRIAPVGGAIQTEAGALVTDKSIGGQGV